MHKTSLGTVSLTADSFGSTEQMDGNPLTPKLARSRLKLRHLRLLLLSACAVAVTACASLQPADHTDPAMAAAQAEAEQAMAQAKEAMAAAEAAAAAQAIADAAATAAMNEAEMARSEADAAMKDAEMARSEAGDAMKDAEMARSEADSASDKLMMATAPHPAEVMVSADQFDASLLDMSGASASLAGPDAIYVSSIMYGGQPYSALLKYSGGTTATVASIFGAHGKMIPDAVDLSRTRLIFRAPDKLVVADVAIGSAGYTGELQHVGGNRLQVTGLRSVGLPPTADEQIAALRAELARAEALMLEADIAASGARAATDAAMADADAARAEGDAARLARSEAEIMAEDAGVAQWVAETEAAAARAALDAMMADVFQPAAIMIGDDQLDPSQASFADARVAVAGPDSVYVSSILYGGQRYSALLKYSGGTTAEVRQIYGSAGKLIPDSVDLSQTELVFVAPNAWQVSNVSVGGVGYSGTLAYAGDGTLQVTGIRQVELPHDALANAQAALAQVEAALAASQADNAAMSDQVASLEANLEAAQDSADMAGDDLDMANATIDAMMADAFQPSAVMISDGQIDPSRASFADARVAIAGPDAVYVSSILYDGQRYSALLRYTGGTTAEVKQIFGSSGKMIPDSVDLSQTDLVFMSPNAWEVSNVSVGGIGYSGTLAYAGNGTLQVTGIRQVELPHNALADAQAALAQVEAALAASQADNAAMSDQVASLEANLEAAQDSAADAQAMAGAAQDSADMAGDELDMANATIDAMMADAYQPSAVMISDGQLDPSRASFADARVAVAGPDAVYVSSILYDGQRYSALLRYTGGTTAEVKQIFGGGGKMIPDSVDLSQTDLVFMSPNAWEVSNVSVGGIGYSGTLAYAGNGKLQVTGIRQVELPHNALAEAKAALADVEAALAASQTANDALQADNAAQGETIASLEAGLAGAQSMAADSMAMADDAQASADMANADLDAMMADAFQPSAVMISDGQIDPSRASFADAHVAIAGPDAVYVSSILYDGQRYSALLRYTGGTTAEVKQIFGGSGKMIPDSVDLSQTDLVFMSPNAWEVSNVSVGGIGYSGTLAYAGNGKLQVTGIRQVELPHNALAEAKAALADVEAALAASQTANDALQADNAAQGETIASLEADLAGAQSMADDAQASADMANADLDAMMADAFQPSAVMISDGQIDPSRASFADAHVAIAGPDAVYVSSILYDGQRYSALLRYTGGTTAEVKQIFGSSGKMIPDSVDLSQTDLVFMSPNAWEVSNVSVGGIGYSGTLAYAGNGTLQVTGIRQVELPHNALAEAKAALAEVEAALAASQTANDALQADNASLEAGLADAQSMAADSMAMADDAQASADMANADLDAMMADAFQPSAVMISDGQLDPSRASFADARVAVAGPDAVYVSSILYDGQRYSALLRYTGGTTAEVKQIFGGGGKMIPDSVDLSQTDLVFVSPNAWEVSNVSVGGIGYSGTLAYAGNGKLQVTGIRQVELPHNALAEAKAALADVEAALAASQTANDALQADNAAQGETIASLEAGLAGAQAMAADSMAMADDAQATADMANADLDAMMADAFQPSAVMISDGQIDPSRASFADAHIAIAGPDSVYVSSILYDGQRYSALLRYTGGTTAEVKQIFGGSGKMIPDSVDLSQTDLVFMSPNAWEVSNVSVGGVGYSGTLAYAGNGTLQVTGIRQVELPATAMEEAQAALAEVEAALAASQTANDALQADNASLAADLADANAMADDAQASADMANADLDAMMADAFQPSAVMISDGQIDPSRASFADAHVAIAGPDSVYVSSILYDGQRYSALLKYTGGTTAEVKQIFGGSGKMIPDSVDLSQTDLVFMSPNAWEVSNVSVGGVGYSGTLAYAGNGTLQVTGIRQVELPHNALAEAKAALADVEAALAASQTANDALQADNASLAAGLADAQSMAADSMAMADDAQATADMANADLDAMMADAFQPSAVMISDGQIDPSRASFADAHVAIAGPDSVYVSSILYDGQRYSALLKYTGGTTAEVKQIFGGSGKMILDSVDLSQTDLVFMSPNAWEVSNVSVGGVGYSGTLAYAGNGTLQVTGIRQVELPHNALAEAKAALADVEAALAASQTANDALQADNASLAAGLADAQSMAADSMAMADDAQATADMANADLDAMMADAFQPSAVMISDGQIDPSRASFADAHIAIAGPDSVYVSSILYDGQRYSALLKYTGGTTAEVKQIFGGGGKMIPDSVDLSQTDLVFMSPNAWDVSNVSVGGIGYSGTLAYAGNGTLRVTGIRQVALPPTALEEAQAALAEVEAALAAAQAENSAQSNEIASLATDLQAANDMAADAQAAVDEAQGKADMAADELATMIAEAFQPSAIMISDGQIDPSRASFADARVSLAGPDSVYVSSIMYDGQHYSALLRYTGGTTAAVTHIFGSSGKLIPDSVDLSQTDLVFVSPNAWEISNVSVGGAGYSGTLAYAGNGTLQVTGIRQVALPPTAMELLAEAKAELEAALADNSAKGAQIASLESELQAAQAALEAAQVAADAAQDAADMANAELDAMMMDMHQPSEVMVSFADLDAGLVNFDNAMASLAGPDAIYVSNIMYAGRPYSALLRYEGGTTATVKQVFGPDGKLIPDSVGLSQTEIAFRSPDTFAVSNVAIGDNGYSGTLQYTGNGQLQVAGIRRVTLPPTEAEMAAAAIAEAKAEAAQMVSDAKAEAKAMVSEAMADADAKVDAAQAAADAAMAEAEAAQDELEAMKMAMHQASEVMVSFADLDAALANFDSAQASLAGPDMIYISSIMYGGQPYSALVKYEGGTTATVLGVFGAAGKLIPDAVGLSQTTVAFVSPDSFAVSNVEVGVVGYAGTLQYTGDGQLQVTGIRRVTLPPTDAENAAAAIDEAMADADQMVSAAMDDAKAKVSAAMAEADQMVSDAKAAADQMVSATMADADAKVDAAMARAAAAEAEMDAMKMAMHQPSAVQVAFAQLDAGLADFGSAQVSLAGPDAIYVSNIMYGGQPYSALLKYAGGTSATVQYVFGPVGKLIPDSVDLSQTTVAFASPDSFTVANVGVGGAGYSGTLQYTGDGQLQVSGLSRVDLPATAEEMLADTKAELADTVAQLAAQKQQLDEANADAEAARLALAAANNALAAANSELDAANGALADAQDRAMALEMEMAAIVAGSSLPGLNPGLLDLESASLTAAGPNEVYISGIQYAGAPVSARIRYDAGTATATALFEGASLVADSLQLDAAQAKLDEGTLVISNVGIEGRAHTLTLTRDADGQVMVAASDDGWDVRTRGELARDNLIRLGNFVVNGFGGGQALAGEGSWTTRSGSVVQTDADASHAKYAIPADQSASELLFGFSANAEGGRKVGFGLHILASATPSSGNTWNYGKSYLLWVTQDPFYDSEDLHLQFYESADDNTLMWLASSRIAHSLSSMINVEALYRDTGMTTLLVNGEEHLTVNIGTAVTGGEAVALRTLGGPVEFTQVYVAAP